MRLKTGNKPDLRRVVGQRRMGDICSLIVKSIDVELSDDPFVIAHGISNNRFKRLDLTETKRILGYDPKSDSFATWNIDFIKESKPKA